MRVTRRRFLRIGAGTAGVALFAGLSRSRLLAEPAPANFRVCSLGSGTGLSPRIEMLPPLISGDELYELSGVKDFKPMDRPADTPDEIGILTVGFVPETVQYLGTQLGGIGLVQVIGGEDDTQAPIIAIPTSLFFPYSWELEVSVVELLATDGTPYTEAVAEPPKVPVVTTTFALVDATLQVSVDEVDLTLP
jgi:hypothetical protein